MDAVHAGRAYQHLPFAGSVLEPLRAWRDVRIRRREADRLILESTGSLPRELAWRAAELTSERERRLLARSVRGVVRELSDACLPGASPLNRVALRPHRRALTALADRLDELDRPVCAAGILRVQRLLTDSDGPLYARGNGGTPVGWALDAAIDGLEPA